LLLHSFEYADAREEFQAASKIEPAFAIAYWGEALTYTHPVWVQQDVPAARAVLARLAPTAEARLALAPTEREKDYLRSVEILYGSGDKVTRKHRVFQRHGAHDEEVPGRSRSGQPVRRRAAWHVPARAKFQLYMRAAAVAEEVFAKNPQHPGAIHYLIHAYDDPIHAPLGLRAARVYREVAGSASHAQHMPSHIFFALGMWDEAIAANIASIAVADERINRKNLGPADRNYHSLLWLEYAYLQEGRTSDARQVLTGIQSPLPMAHMQATYAIKPAIGSAPPRILISVTPTCLPKCPC
jgi:hypothetical protein